MDGAEAATFGAIMARCTRVLKEATRAEVVYIYIFGDGVLHLHVHMAPHSTGDALSDQMIRGEITEEKLPFGMTCFERREFPPLPLEHLREIAEPVRVRLAG